MTTTNAGVGEIAMNHNLNSYGVTDTLHSSSYQALQPELQHNAPSSFAQGKGLPGGADGTDTLLSDQVQAAAGQGPEAELPPPDQEEPTIDIVINNVVSSFSTRCHLDLKRIAQQGCNVMYRRENGVRVVRRCSDNDDTIL